MCYWVTWLIANYWHNCWYCYTGKCPSKNINIYHVYIHMLLSGRGSMSFLVPYIFKIFTMFVSLSWYILGLEKKFIMCTFCDREGQEVCMFCTLVKCYFYTCSLSTAWTIHYTAHLGRNITGKSVHIQQCTINRAQLIVQHTEWLTAPQWL